MNEINDDTHKLFGIIAESHDYDKEMVLLNLPFARLMDEIIVPYHSGEAFFIDGVPVSKEKIKRIKIIELSKKFQFAMDELKRGMTINDNQTKKIYGDQYSTRFEHILRTSTTDVTSQVIKAYDQVIKPNIKDYLPKRSELIDAATKVFIEAMKILSN